MDKTQSPTDSGHYRQPARSVLIDLSPPLSQSTCKQICSGLDNLLAMVCSLSGQSRLPSLSITTLGAFPEILLPFQHVRGNFSRLQCAVEEVQRVFSEVPSTQAGRLPDACLLQALQDVSEQFKRQTKTMIQTSGHWCQLEIVVITCQDCHKVGKQIEKMTSSLSLDNLRRIQVVSVLEELMGEDVTEPTGSQKSSTSEASSEMGGLGVLVDTVQIECDDLSIQNYFNSWLKDVATDREHLHIHLPSTSPESKTLTLKCDLQERMINPQLLPGLSLSLQMHNVNVLSKPTQQAGIKSADQTPIYHIRVEKMLPASAVCESTVFGMPLIVQPTSCWKIDWEDLEQNQQTFQSLCQILSDRDMVLLGSAVIPRIPQRAVYTCEGEELTAWFVILSARSSLLIKSIAVKELMLPCNDTFQTDKPNEESRQKVIDSLEQLETIGLYNPLLTHSGLYKVLKSQYRKPVIGRQPRKKFNYKPQPEPSKHGDSKNSNKPEASVTFKRFCPPGSLGSSLSFPTEL